MPTFGCHGVVGYWVGPRGSKVGTKLGLGMGKVEVSNIGEPKMEGKRVAVGCWMGREVVDCRNGYRSFEVGLRSFCCGGC